MFTVSDDTQEITVTEAGFLADVSGETIRRAIRRGELQATRRIGVNVLVRRADIERWAAARRGREPESGQDPTSSN